MKNESYLVKKNVLVRFQKESNRNQTPKENTNVSVIQ